MPHWDQRFPSLCSYKRHCMGQQSWMGHCLKQLNKVSAGWLWLKGQISSACSLVNVPWARLWELLHQKVCVFQQMVGLPLAA